MRRCALAISLAFMLAMCAFAQEGGQEGVQQDHWIAWKWANFVILIAGLGYLAAKHAPALFAKRAQEIQQGIFEAAKTKKDAEGRAAAIELRLTGLENEIESLRVTARAEIASEGERIQRETEQRLARIQEQSGQEIALMSRGARDELRNFSAQLALDLADQRIRARITPNIQDVLVDGFLQDLRQRLKPGARN